MFAKGQALPLVANKWQALGRTCCLQQAEDDCGSGETELRGYNQERSPVPAFARDLGLFAQNCRIGHERIFEPREVVFLGSPSEEEFYNKAQLLCTECLLYTLSRPLWFLVLFGMPDVACLSSSFIPFTCSCAEAADQSNSTGSHLIPVS